jgi:hypothetical protein
MIGRAIVLRQPAGGMGEEMCDSQRLPLQPK